MEYYSAIKRNEIKSVDVDEPRACHTEWNESEKEKQIPYVIAYIWNLEKWYWWAYLQGRNRDTDIKNRLTDMKNGLTDKAGKGKDGANWVSSTETHTLPYVK